MRRRSLLLIVVLLLAGIALFAWWLLRVPTGPLAVSNAAADQSVSRVFARNPKVFALVWIADLAHALDFLQPVVPQLRELGPVVTTLVRGLTDDLWLLMSRVSDSPREWVWSVRVPMAPASIRGLFALQLFLPRGWSLEARQTPVQCGRGFQLKGLHIGGWDSVTGAYCQPYLVLSPDATWVDRLGTTVNLDVRPRPEKDEIAEFLLARVWFQPRRMPERIRKRWLRYLAPASGAQNNPVKASVYWVEDQHLHLVVDLAWPK